MNKELNALKRIASIQVITDVEKDIVERAIDITPFAFALIESALKVLQIIKEKQVNVFIFLHSGEDLDTYNDMVEENRKLTQEEFELLKECLKWLKLNLFT